MAESEAPDSEFNVPLVANRDMKYGTRQLKAGDGFHATAKHARLLKGIKHARDGETPAPPEPVVKPVQQSQESVQQSSEPVKTQEPAQEPVKTQEPVRSAQNQQPRRR